MKYFLSCALWTAFSAAVVASSLNLLHACGIAGPANLVMAWNFCPSLPASLSIEAQREEHAIAELAQLRRELADEQMACAAIPPPEPPALTLPTQAGLPRPQQTAALRPPPPPPAPRPSPGSLDEERWRNKDLSVLEGCWRLGQDQGMNWVTEEGAIIEAGCTQRAGRLCFDSNGHGTNEESGFCPSGRVFDCRGPMTAHFNPDGTATAYQPPIAGGCNNGANPLWERTITCRRIDDTRASCSRQFRFGGDTVDFRR